MRVTVVGSADAFNSAGRGHSCYIIEAPGAGPVMIDFGASALSGLRKAGRQPAELRGLAITHLHGDHIGGLPFLMIDALFHDRREQSLQVLGPIGFWDRFDQLYRVTYGDVADFKRPYDLQVHEIGPDASTELLGFGVSTFPADHMDPPDQPLCLRFEAPNGKQVAFSGDTSMCDGLRAAARGADLLIAECTGLRHPIGRHIAWEDWALELPRLDVPRVLLSHLGDDVRDAAERGELTTEADLRLEFADDGRIIDL